MKVSMLNTAYLAEDGYVFECGNLNDFTRVLKTVGTSNSSEEAADILKKKGVPFKMYKEEKIK